MVSKDTKKLTAIRLEDEDRERIGALAEALTARAHGAEVTASQALRVALRRGLDAIEAEMAEGKKGRR